LSTAQGSGDGQVTYVIAANTATTDRTGSLTVAGTTVTVTQHGSAPPAPTITLSGSVAGLSGECPDVTFTVDGHAVRTSTATSYEGGSCGKLKNRDAVIVRGVVDAGGGVDATEVEFNK
jgi:hypothetical protein